MNTIRKLSYAEGLKDLRESLLKSLPQTILKIFDNDAKKLQQNHKTILKLNVGDTAPDFTLLNAIGVRVSLYELLKVSTVILVFYRGNWCVYCNLQLHTLQQSLPEIKEFGAQLVAISPQNPDETLNTTQNNQLGYQVLSDNGNIVAKRYTTVFKNSDEANNVMQKLGIDYIYFYSDDSNELPIPAVFIIDRQRKIIFAKSEGGDYRHRVEPQEIIEALYK